MIKHFRLILYIIVYNMNIHIIKIYASIKSPALQGFLSNNDTIKVSLKHHYQYYRLSSEKAGPAYCPAPGHPYR